MVHAQCAVQKSVGAESAWPKTRGAIPLTRLSIGVEWCPPIGVQKCPLCRAGEQARGGVAFPLAQPTRACVLEGVQARVLMRQLSLPVSTMSQWWVRRSSSAVVIFASPNTVGHSPNARLVVTMTEVCS